MTVTKPNTTPKTTATTAYALRALAVPLLAGLLFAPVASAVCGDVNANQEITVTDAQLVLKKAVGQDVALVCEDQCAVLEARIAALETLLANLSTNGDNLVLTGMNFQVVSGEGETDADINGTGNVIIGYNETDDGNDDDRTGSHNLVIGRFHSYSSYGGIVAGEDNEISGEVASVLGGAQNSTDGDGAVVVGGQDNQADGETSVIVAGENNRTLGRSCSVASGNQNLCTGLSGAISGGANNFCSGAGSVIGGTSNRTLNSNLGWLAGSLGPVF